MTTPTKAPDPETLEKPKRLLEVRRDRRAEAQRRPDRLTVEVMAHHLDDVLLACLKKDPAERPADAPTLRQRLKACRGVGNWELEDARAWWGHHGEAIGARRLVHDISGAQTVDIALQILRGS